MSTIDPVMRRRRTRTVWAWLSFVAALVLIWSHWSIVGRSLPDRANEIATTTTGSVFGMLPYVVIDDAGSTIRWPGLALGLASTAVAALLLRQLLRWIDRTTS